MVYVCFSLSTFTFSIQIDPFVGAFHIFWLFLQRVRCVKVNIVSTSSILCVYVSLWYINTIQYEYVVLGNQSFELLLGSFRYIMCRMESVFVHYQHNNLIYVWYALWSISDRLCPVWRQSTISYQFDPDCVWGFGQRLSHASFNPSIRSINCVQLIDQLSSLWKWFSIWISIETLALIHASRPNLTRGLYLLDCNQHWISVHFWWFLVTVRISYVCVRQFIRVSVVLAVMVVYWTTMALMPTGC